MEDQKSVGVFYLHHTDHLSRLTPLLIVEGGRVYFRGYRMKITLEGLEGLGYLRCEEDGKVILSFQNGKITLQDCEHYHWHLTTGNPGIPDMERDINIKKFNLDDWEEYLIKEHVGIIAVDDKWLYLMHYTEKVWEPPS